MIISEYCLIQYKNQTILLPEYLAGYLMTPMEQQSIFQNISEIRVQIAQRAQTASALSLLFSPSSQVFHTSIAASSLSLPTPAMPLQTCPSASGPS